MPWSVASGVVGWGYGVDGRTWKWQACSQMSVGWPPAWIDHVDGVRARLEPWRANDCASFVVGRGIEPEVDHPGIALGDHHSIFVVDEARDVVAVPEGGIGPHRKLDHHLLARSGDVVGHAHFSEPNFAGARTEGGLFEHRGLASEASLVLLHRLFDRAMKHQPTALEVEGRGAQIGHGLELVAHQKHGAAVAGHFPHLAKALRLEF